MSFVHNLKHEEFGGEQIKSSDTVLTYPQSETINIVRKKYKMEETYECMYSWQIIKCKS